MPMQYAKPCVQLDPLPSSLCACRGKGGEEEQTSSKSNQCMAAQTKSWGGVVPVQLTSPRTADVLQRELLAAVPVACTRSMGEFQLWLPTQVAELHAVLAAKFLTLTTACGATQK